MNIKYKWLSISYLVILFLIPGCNKDDIPYDKVHPINGNWEFVVSSEEPSYTLYHMKRTSELSEKYGSLYFGPEGEFKNANSWGFTGQPTMFTGTWSAQNDTIILVEMTFPFTEKWKMAIKKVDKESLEYYFLYDK
jgi:hypothetical protein